MLQYEWKVTVGRLIIKVLIQHCFFCTISEDARKKLAVATFALLTVSWILSTTRLDLISYLK